VWRPVASRLSRVKKPNHGRNRKIIWLVAFRAWAKLDLSRHDGPSCAGRRIRQFALSVDLPVSGRSGMDVCMPRKLLIALVGLATLLVVGDTLYWGVAQQRLREQFAAWAANARANGWTVMNAPPSSGGWPLAATLSVPALFIKGGDPDLPRGLAWRADRIELGIALLQPHTLEIKTEGMQRIRLAGGPEIFFTADRLRGWLPLGPDMAPQSADLAATNLRAGILAGPDAALDLSIGSLRIRAVTKPAATAESALAISLAATTIGLPPRQRWPLGSRIEQVRLEATLDGPVPHVRGLAARAYAWRDGGGSLNVPQLSLNWGALALTATATLTLDEHLQPTGAGIARLTGYADALDTLSANGVLSRSATTAAKAVLSLLARVPEDDGPPDVEVPLTLESRTLSLRQLPLFRMPEIDWREPATALGFRPAD